MNIELNKPLVSPQLSSAVISFICFACLHACLYLLAALQLMTVYEAVNSLHLLNFQTASFALLTVR